jgi:hypothetical protein
MSYYYNRSYRTDKCINRRKEHHADGDEEQVEQAITATK